MALCPDDARELAPDPSGSLGCKLCGGALCTEGELEAIAPSSVEALKVEVRPDSGAFARTRACPTCRSPMVPMRMGQLDAWLEKCPSCEGYWVERQDRRAFQWTQPDFGLDGGRELASHSRDLSQVWNWVDCWLQPPTSPGRMLSSPGRHSERGRQKLDFSSSSFSLFFWDLLADDSAGAFSFNAAEQVAPLLLNYQGRGFLRNCGSCVSPQSQNRER